MHEYRMSGLTSMKMILARWSTCRAYPPYHQERDTRANITGHFLGHLLEVQMGMRGGITLLLVETGQFPVQSKEQSMDRIGAVQQP